MIGSLQMNPQKVTVFLLGLIAAGLVALALDFAQPVLMPLVIAILFDDELLKK